MAKDKLRKILDRELYKKCLAIKEAIEKESDPVFFYDQDIHWYISFYQGLVPKEVRDRDDRVEALDSSS